MTQKFNIETDDTSEHMRLMRVARLFDRHYYYDPENIGEVINDGVKTAIRMVREVNKIIKAEPSCLNWMNIQLLYDLNAVSDLTKELYGTAMTAQKEWEMQTTFNDKKTAESENGHVDGSDSEPAGEERMEGAESIDSEIVTAGEEKMEDEDDGIPF